MIEILRRLNDRGYGQGESGLVLNLVHNPGGAYLPASQAGLEAHYRRTLREKHGIRFDHLFCITNMPVGRYLDYLRRTDNYQEYMRALVRAFNPATLGGVMCRRMLSVGWDGSLYDCDFNQMLGLATDHDAPGHISDFRHREAGRPPDRHGRPLLRLHRGRGKLLPGRGSLKTGRAPRSRKNCSPPHPGSTCSNARDRPGAPALPFYPPGANSFLFF